MLPASKQKILASLGDEDRVLDVGGWAKPLARADSVIDLMPYETRGLYGDRDPDPERFTAESWVQCDFCDRSPWPFADNEFDFVVCSHTLEDVRDPVWVCSEISRVGRAGYIEVPSRLEEQALGVHAPGWAGWSHHHWLVDVLGDRLEFVFKSHALHSDERFHFPPGFGATLRAEERVQSLFWEGTLPAAERIFVDADGLDDYLSSLIDEHRALLAERLPDEAGPIRRAARRIAPR